MDTNYNLKDFLVVLNLNLKKNVTLSKVDNGPQIAFDELHMDTNYYLKDFLVVLNFNLKKL